MVVSNIFAEALPQSFRLNLCRGSYYVPHIIICNSSDKVNHLLAGLLCFAMLSQISTLKLLQELDLSYNNFTGPFPPSVRLTMFLIILPRVLPPDRMAELHEQYAHTLGFVIIETCILLYLQHKLSLNLVGVWLTVK